MYCEDCKQECYVVIDYDHIGDFAVVNGVQEIEVWKCSECGGENLSETKQVADPVEEPATCAKDMNQRQRR